MDKNIGFLSTRFAGTDGVTLEASKWAEVYEKTGHNCFWFAGELDRESNKSFLVPEAHFEYEKNRWINERIFGKKRRTPEITAAIHESRSFLKAKLHTFIEKFKIDILIAENILTIPMHVPLGIALAETLAETQTPTIAHHHDFYWERVRFTVNAINDYLGMAFPANLPNIEHVVINSAAREELAHRRGISSIIIPNVLDFENPPNAEKRPMHGFRESIGLNDDDIIILQPTRLVKRKGIEYAVELVKALSSPRYKLVISHEPGDEGFEYPNWIKEYAQEHGVDLRLVTTKVSDPWAGHNNTTAQYSLWDIYPQADFITFPSRLEGFGNAFLEAIYFKKPILINRYATFVRDIEPLGFDLAIMDGFLSKKTVEQIKEILESDTTRNRMVSTNYTIAARHYSYSVLKKHLDAIMINFFGEYIPKHMQKVVSAMARLMIHDK